MNKKLVSAFKSKAYDKFVNERDRAAERMLGNARLEQTDLMRKHLSDVFGDISAFLIRTKRDLPSLEQKLKARFVSAGVDLAAVNQKLRRYAYVLSLVGEAEAIGRAQAKPTRYKVDDQLLLHVKHSPSMSGGHVDQRTQLYMDRMCRDIMDALQNGLSRVTLDQHGNKKPESTQEIMKRVVRALPDVKRQKTVKVLSKVTEADAAPTKPVEFSSGFVDDTLWDEIVDDYTNDYIPKYRGADYEIDTSNLIIPDDERVYAWEAEQDLTEDFVKQVREGQIEAASQNGIAELVWIAIIDDKTDEGCVWRDGLTTSQIEDQMDDHGDDCCDGATTPPGHFKCRCRLAPALESVQDNLDVDVEGFNDWANS